MNLAKDIQVYVKTTGTCNLDCSHCFTSGSKGKNIHFDEYKTFRFLDNLARDKNLNSIRLMYHGGEPLITPLEKLYRFYDLTQSLPVKVDYGLQTNLVYPLTNDKLHFINSTFKTGIGTSWDPNIRFGSNNPKLKEKQLKLWEENVRTLSEMGHAISLMVCLSKDLISDYHPSQIIEYAIELGIRFIQFERITSDGNAVFNQEIMPNNIDVSSWIDEMYQSSVDNKYYQYIGNMFINELARGIVNRVQVGTKCRSCEQSLITINADGTVAGCPNSATEKTWGRINDPIDEFLLAPKRIEAICHEKERNLNCFSCDVKFACNGDCYKLPWQGDVCPAPKNLLQQMHHGESRDLLKEFIL